MDKFFKYQSLGNDFILLDFYQKSDQELSQFLHQENFPKIVAQICDRHFGIGADGLLVLKNSSGPEMLIFNSDGSQAEICLNGLRCVSLHLFSRHHFPEDFFIKVGSQNIGCQIQSSKKRFLSTLLIDNVEYQNMQTIALPQETISGHVVSVGNPHFLIFQKQTLDWLKKNGKILQSNPLFSHGTNVSLIWQGRSLGTTKRFHVIVYERGCGITLGCGSSGAAIIKTFFKMGKMQHNEDIILSMQGGNMRCTIDSKEKMHLCSTAALVYEGKY